MKEDARSVKSAVPGMAEAGKSKFLQYKHVLKSHGFFCSNSIDTILFGDT